MYVPDIALHDATCLEQASSLLAQYAPSVRILAGGTDLLVDLKTGRTAVDHVVSISRLSELRGVSADEEGLSIGALTTPNQLAASPIVRERFPAILDATRDLAAPQVRNMATVGGNIASAVPSADLPPILMVLGASVRLWSARRERTVPLEAYFLGPRKTVREEDEILTRITVPFPERGCGAAYARFALRAANACAVAGVAAWVRLDVDGTVHDARLALCAVAPTPRLVKSAAVALLGRPPDADVFALAAAATIAASEPISDTRGSEHYRRDVVGVLTQRALAAAVKRAREMVS